MVVHGPFSAGCMGHTALFSMYNVGEANHPGTAQHATRTRSQHELILQLVCVNMQLQPFRLHGISLTCRKDASGCLLQGPECPRSHLCLAEQDLDQQGVGVVGMLDLLHQHQETIDWTSLQASALCLCLCLRFRSWLLVVVFTHAS